jgi:hypothetical protein
MYSLILTLIHFRFDELEVGALPPIRLNFLGSRAILEGALIGTGTEKHTFPTHQSPISRPLSTLPEPTTSLSNQDSFADTAVLGSVDLLAGAVATYHTICVFVRVIGFRVVASR